MKKSPTQTALPVESEEELEIARFMAGAAGCRFAFIDYVANQAKACGEEVDLDVITEGHVVLNIGGEPSTEVRFWQEPIPGGKRVLRIIGRWIGLDKPMEPNGEWGSQ